MRKREGCAFVENLTIDSKILKEENSLVKNYSNVQSLINVEQIAERFEQDARRYKRYLGDDSQVVLV